MKIHGINTYQSQLKNPQIKSNNSINNSLSNKTEIAVNNLRPYYYPILNVGNFNKSKITFGTNQIEIEPSNIPEEITNKGYKYLSNVKLQDKDGKPVLGYAFIKTQAKTEKHDYDLVYVLITDAGFDDVGSLSSKIEYDKLNNLYSTISYNNYANIYGEYRCDSDSPIKGYGSKAHCTKQYKRVGTELCRVYEEYIKEKYPDIKYIEACPVREGSRILLEKIGYKYDHNESGDLPGSWGDEDGTYSFDYYRKYFK